MHRPECSAFTWYRLILFLRRAGGFTVAGPSKGPDRNRQSQKHPLRTSRPDRRLVCEEKLLPELSNFCCLPGKAGGSPYGLGVYTLKMAKLTRGRRFNRRQASAGSVSLP